MPTWVLDLLVASAKGRACRGSKSGPAMLHELTQVQQQRREPDDPGRRDRSRIPYPSTQAALFPDAATLRSAAAEATLSIQRFQRG
jgi:hypothetical protein